MGFQVISSLALTAANIQLTLLKQINIFSVFRPILAAGAALYILENGINEQFKYSRRNKNE